MTLANINSDEPKLNFSEAHKGTVAICFGTKKPILSRVIARKFPPPARSQFDQGINFLPFTLERSLCSVVVGSVNKVDQI
jgi:hypothetical protein